MLIFEEYDKDKFENVSEEFNLAIYNDGLLPPPPDHTTRPHVKILVIKKVLAEIIHKHYNVYWIGDKKGFFARYHKGVYHKDIYEYLKTVIKDLLDYNAIIGYSDNSVNEVIAECKRYRLKITDFEQDTENYINFKNCLLNLDTFEIEEHTPELLTFIQIPWEYHPHKKSAVFRRFLYERLVCTHRIKDIYEIFGYCLTSSVRMQMAFIFQSPKGEHGKSAVINILNTCVGFQNYSQLTLQYLATKQFAMWGLVNKLLNTYGDLPEDMIKSKGILKELITGYYLAYEEKNGKVDLKQRKLTKNVFSCNDLPYVKKIDHAFTRRFKIIPFHIPITDKITNWEYDNIINIDDEIEGIIAESMTALKYLYKRGSFRTISQEESLERWLIQTNFIYRFVKEKCKVGHDEDGDVYFIPEEDLYRKFQEYQDQSENYYSYEKNKFTSVLKSRFKVRQNYKVVEDLNGNKERVKCYIGIDMKEVDLKTMRF